MNNSCWGSHAACYPTGSALAVQVGKAARAQWLPVVATGVMS
ncbi:hypothetical protein [Nostoc sp. DSM 114161]